MRYLSVNRRLRFSIIEVYDPVRFINTIEYLYTTDYTTFDINSERV